MRKGRDADALPALCFGADGRDDLAKDRASAGEELVAEGKTRLRVKRKRATEISEEQLATFFEGLADTCNVSLAARRAGFTANWAYRRRKFDAAFRNSWSAAVREGYAKLELVLLERAMKGTPKVIHRAGGDETIREYSNTLAIALLRRHAETIDGLDGLEEDETANAELRTKILGNKDNPPTVSRTISA